MKTFLFGFLLIVAIIYVLLVNIYLLSNDNPLPNKIQTSYKMQRMNWSTNPYEISRLNVEDFTTLMNLSDFKFLINSKRCELESHNKNNLFIVVFIHSAPNHFDKRLAIRKTWGNEKILIESKMRVVFLVGQVINSSVQRDLIEENERFNDLVQGNFIDSYRNLTYKHIMGLKWIVYFCRNAKYIFKTDDDIFVDIFQLIFYLKGTFGNTYPPKNIINCYVIRNPYPKRSQRSKWRVTFQEYPDKYYPPYCSGWGILMSPDVVFKLYISSKDLPFFWVDDVYISGVLARHIGVNHLDFSPKLAIGDNDIDLWLSSNRLSIPPLFGHPDTDLQTIYALWNKTIKYYKVKYKSIYLI